uniref:Pyrin domain-containing protein n=1 Tax=Pygocentrus nattereri TaxID=42514 RepID=A0AAR2L4A4_PYGNA
MVNIQPVLLDILQNLLEEDLKSFQWYLSNGVEGFTHIPRAQLEKADRHDTVDKMVQSYGHNGAVEITQAILKNINQNQLAEELRTSLREGSFYGKSDTLELNRHRFSSNFVCLLVAM